MSPGHLYYLLTFTIIYRTIISTVHPSCVATQTVCKHVATSADGRCTVHTVNICSEAPTEQSDQQTTPSPYHLVFIKNWRCLLPEEAQLCRNMLHTFIEVLQFIIIIVVVVVVVVAAAPYCS
jgi:hypothetical protein